MVGASGTARLQFSRLQVEGDELDFRAWLVMGQHRLTQGIFGIVRHTVVAQKERRTGAPSVQTTGAGHRSQVSEVSRVANASPSQWSKPYSLTAMSRPPSKPRAQ